MFEKISYIMRGIPGSGKTHTAKQLCLPEHIFSTDDFWGPDYNWDPEKIRVAHNWNQRRWTEAINQGLTPIAVDNTNTTWKEIEFYVTQALNNNYTVVITEPISDWWPEILEAIKSKDNLKIDKAAQLLKKHGTHDVPQQALIKMMNRWVLSEDIKSRIVTVQEANIIVVSE